jgi:hypothetical protein
MSYSHNIAVGAGNWSPVEELKYLNAEQLLEYNKHYLCMFLLDAIHCSKLTRLIIVLSQIDTIQLVRTYGNRAAIEYGEWDDVYQYYITHDMASLTGSNFADKKAMLCRYCCDRNKLMNLVARNAAVSSHHVCGHQGIL